MDQNDSGREGSSYQIKLLALIALEGLNHDGNWKEFTEYNDAGDFNDIVYLSENKNSSFAIQCKHKRDKKKTKISKNDLVKKGDFYLPKYFKSFQEMKNKWKKFDEMIFVICSNCCPDTRTVSETEEKISIPLFPGETSSYKLKDLVVKEILNSYDDQLVTNFCEKLRFFHITDSQIDESMKGSLTDAEGNLKLKFDENHFIRNIDNWYIGKNRTTIVKSHVIAFLYEWTSHKKLTELESLGIYFKEKYIIGNNQILNIITAEESILTILKAYRSFLEDYNTNQILFIDPEDKIEIIDRIIECYELPRFCILLISSSGFGENSETCYNHINNILEEFSYKKVIIFSKESIQTHLSKRNITTIFDKVNFDHLRETSQKTLLSKSVCFQGTDIPLYKLIYRGTNLSIDELMNDRSNLSYLMDQKTIVELIFERKIEIGTAINENSGDIPVYYRERRITNYVGEDFEEQDVRDFVEQSDKIFLISNEAGMGKTTFLKKLGYLIKKKYPHLFVLRIDLNQFTGLFETHKNKGIELEEILGIFNQNLLKNSFEKSIFSMNDEIVLLVDAVDEMSPTYTKLVKKFLLSSSKRKNISKIFITTRPHLKTELESFLNTKSYQLCPYWFLEQVVFLGEYWKNNLNINDVDDENKCNMYAQKLMSKLIKAIGTTDAWKFTGIPLHIEMIGEIFLESDKKQNNWISCKDFLISGYDNPELPIKLTLNDLYDMFMQKKSKIFIDEKCLAKGNTATKLLFESQFENALIKHQKEAAKLLFKDSHFELMNISKIVENIPIETIVKMGIIHELEDGLVFIHKTFAEYFVAKALWKQLIELKYSQEFLVFLLSIVFLDEQYEGIRNFFEGILTEEFDEIPEEILCICDSIVDSITWNETTNIHILAREGRLNILKIMLGKRVKRKQLLGIIDYSSGSTILKEGIVYPEIITLLLDKGADVNQRDEWARTIIHYAGIHRKMEVLKLCVDRGADINQIDIYGCSVALYAARENHVELVKFCMENGADMNQKDMYGRDAIELVAERGNVELVQLSVDRGFAINPKVIYHAASLGKLELMQLCMQTSKVDMNQRDESGTTIIFQAAQGGGEKLVKFCLENGADINQSNTDGSTVLLNAAERGDLGLMKFLLENGADLNQSDHRGRTVTHYAAATGHLEMLKFCVGRGTDINQKDKNGKTTILYAAGCEKLEVMRFCIENGADIHHCENEGRSLIHFAAASGNLMMMKFCLEIGANINQRDNDGKTAIIYRRCN
ncbi:unnamed protein product [Phaedon cochleariae]|uniref:NACHT domain-containing protein n=1 Tax=Phaedon cochleariae TaxID=80249 RepID=A0A9N9X192_PHACE|nr:unnamed protein product [Phaedon cochleariae]